ncbi:Uncharacterised protein [Fluoribacter dumoffii]|uniref:Uncharacterized protein n=1 Tax=Fluoribacter dumoffii TaxID=463 RepID=A0A377G7Y9_9GAMM|nr:Uncharacterised protein [Fluoribacter dumoffii]
MTILIGELFNLRVNQQTPIKTLLLLLAEFDIRSHT